MTNYSAKRDPNAAASESFVAHVGRIGDALEEVEHQLELLKRTLRKCPLRKPQPDLPDPLKDGSGT